MFDFSEFSHSANTFVDIGGESFTSQYCSHLKQAIFYIISFKIIVKEKQYYLSISILF